MIYILDFFEDQKSERTHQPEENKVQQRPAHRGKTLKVLEARRHKAKMNKVVEK